MTGPTARRVLLVGFMGSGKTSVGRRLAERLGWRFIDFDDEIEAEAGIAVSEIFHRHGEPHFREMECAVAHRLLSEDEVVLGSGGGWAAAPDRLEAVPSGTISIWLRVSSEQAVRRVSSAPRKRPLLDVADPIGEARSLLATRAPFYDEADWAVDTEHTSVEDVSSRILEIISGSTNN